MQKGGELLEGNAFTEKTITAYSSGGKKTKIELKEKRAGEEDTVEITSAAWPGLALRGSANGESINLTEARVLSSHLNGWNEFTIELLGSAFLKPIGNNEALLLVPEKIERVQIVSGKIRLKENYLIGDAALNPLRNRRERILTIVEWMNERRDNEVIFNNQKDFNAYWKRILFPELVTASKRPAAYTVENAEFKRADDIRWNKSYTELIFTAEHWEYRNSGALLRDWEEALPWIYMEYSWDLITDSFDNTVLTKKK